MQNPLCWPGGKTYLAPAIHKLAPPHKTRLIPFGGGLGEFWNWPHEGVSEVVNDLDGRLCLLWRVLRDPALFEEFQRKAEATPVSRELWQEAFRADARGHGGLSQADAALSFFLLIRQSMLKGGKGWAPLSTSRTRRGMNEQCSAWLSAVEGLPQVHARLKRVAVENLDAVQFIEKYDKPDCLAYCFHPDTRVRTSDGEMRPIQNLQVGDCIHPGRIVKGVYRRPYSGACLTISAQGLPSPIVVTPEHRIPRIPRHFKRQETRTDDQLWSQLEAVPAEHLRPNDYLLVPLGGESKTPDWVVTPTGFFREDNPQPFRLEVTPELCRFIGYYAAEGHLAYCKDGVPRSACLSFGEHERETWVADANHCSEAAFGLTAKLKKLPGVCQMQYHRTSLAKFLGSCLSGTGKKHNQRLSPDVMRLPPELQFEVLRGWMRGEAGLSQNGRNRYKLQGTSASRDLAEQMYVIALRCGLRPSFKWRARRAFDVYFASADAERLGWCVPRKRKDVSTRRIINDHMLVRVRSVIPVAHTGFVYDIQVDGDHLFACPFALAHNCDPPYTPGTRTDSLYRHEMSEGDHSRLLEALVSFSGKVLLSGYSCELYENKLGGWSRREVRVKSAMTKSKDKPDRVEVFWANYELPAEGE